MAKHYKYVNGKRLIVVNNYELGSDVIPEEVNLIPDITQADEGKVLMADENGEPKWTSIPSQLPTISGNNDKVLKVNSGATGVEWDDESTELPSLTGNADKVLKVNSAGTGVEWSEAGGGDDFNFVTVTNNNNTLSSDITAEKVFQDLQAGKRYGVKYKNAPSEEPVFIGELLVSTVSTNTQVKASVINLDGSVGNNGPGSIAIRAIWIRYYNSSYTWSKSYGVAQIATTVPGT